MSTEVVAWGRSPYGAQTVPAGFSNAVSVAAGWNHSVALLEDGTVRAWGWNFYGQTNVPPSLSNVVQVAAGRDFSLALKDDGTVVAWGEPTYGKTTVPSGLTNVVQVAAGGYIAAALRSDGSVVTWGYEAGAVPPWITNDIAQISVSGLSFVLALRENGTVAAWGEPRPYSLVPPGDPADIVAVSAGDDFSVALKADGTVIAWGDNWLGQTNVPSSLANVISIDAGKNHALALKNDGTVVSWGWNDAGQRDIPSGLSGVLSVSAGGDHSMVLKGPVFPRIQVERLSGAVLTTDAASELLPATLVGSSVSAGYTIRSIGGAPLQGVSFAIAGANTNDFALTQIPESDIPIGAAASLSLSFTPTVGGNRSVQLVVTSNDPENSPFVINLSGYGLSTEVDFDADGLNDAAEYAMSGLGFNWQLAQPTLVATLFDSASFAGLDNFELGRSAGRTDVTANPAAYGLFTAAQYNLFGSQRFTAGQTSVTTNPSAFNLFTKAQFDANRTNGRSDVTTNPSAYGLFTAAQYNLFGAQRFSNGVSSVLNSIPRVEVSAPGSTFLRLGMLSSNFTGITVSNVPPGWRFDTNARQLIGTFAGTNPVNATMVARRGTNPPVSVPVTFKPLVAQTITWTNLPGTNNFASNGLIPLRATSSSGLAVIYTSANTNILQINGTNAVMRGRGTNTITASQGGNTNFNAAPNVVRTIVIK